jgi:hypothetical protein
MSALDSLLDSYLDIARQRDPLRYPVDAPAETRFRLGQFDPLALRAHAMALRSIANAAEELGEIDALDDEVDRTMLLDTLRADLIDCMAWADAESCNPAMPLQHIVAALRQVLGDGDREPDSSALQARIAVVPDLLGVLERDPRPVPDYLVRCAVMAAELIDDDLMAAEEYVATDTVRSAQEALNAHLDWLRDPARGGGVAGLGDDVTEARLRTLGATPAGVQGTLRVLELRRTGVERGLAKHAADLGYDDWPAALDARRRMEEDDFDRLTETWSDAWRRVGDMLTSIGLVTPSGEAPDPPADTDDPVALTVLAARGHATRMLVAAITAQPRRVRRQLVAPGLLGGWGRTVAALLRTNNALLSPPEYRLMIAHRALRDGAAAEADLLLEARRAGFDELVERTTRLLGGDEREARVLSFAVGEAPFMALAAALAHEAWQAWYAETGGDPVEFLQRALAGGGLTVPLARWALTS